jgi:hypothetical protein
LIWLHTYGERLVPEGEKFGAIPKGLARCTVAVPSGAEGYPETFEYEAGAQRLKVGDGVFEPVPREAWEFSISGLEVLKSWLSYRMRDSAGRRSSRLDEVLPTQWSASFTEELCRLLWLIEETLNLIPRAAELLAAIVAGSVLDKADLPSPSAEEKAAPKVSADQTEQLTMGTD